MYKFISSLLETLSTAIPKIISDISNVMYSYLLIILLLVVGLYFTFRTKFVQLRMLKESLRLVTEKSSSGKSTILLLYLPYLARFSVPPLILKLFSAVFPAVP